MLRLIAEGRTYEQILSLHPEMSYLDVFAAREALEILTQAGEDYAERLAQSERRIPAPTRGETPERTRSSPSSSREVRRSGR